MADRQEYHIISRDTQVSCTDPLSISKDPCTDPLYISSEVKMSIKNILKKTESHHPKRVQRKVRKRITYSGESHYPASPNQSQTHKSSYDSRFDTKCAFVPASQLRIQGAQECMSLSTQIELLKTRFDSYQTDLNQRGTSNVEDHMIKAPVFQQCFDLKCALQHIIKNYKIV